MATVVLCHGAMSQGHVWLQCACVPGCLILAMGYGHATMHAFYIAVYPLFGIWCAKALRGLGAATAHSSSLALAKAVRPEPWPGHSLALTKAWLGVEEQQWRQWVCNVHRATTLDSFIS